MDHKYDMCFIKKIRLYIQKIRSYNIYGLQAHYILDKYNKVLFFNNKLL